MSIKYLLVTFFVAISAAATHPPNNQTHWNETTLPETSTVNETHAVRNRTRCITDHLLFKLSLPEFSDRRNRYHPPSVSWVSDGCTSSPNNPFGFPYLPACHRHDFGYENFRLENRFTKAAKKIIDSKFKDDLYFQCNSVWARKVCRALANVYHAGVRKGGGKDARDFKRSPDQNEEEDLIEAYNKAVEAYNKEVEIAQAAGDLPHLAHRDNGKIDTIIL